MADWETRYATGCRRISAPINRALIAAVDKHETPANVRALQRDWDRIILPRAILQGLAIAALCVNLTCGLAEGPVWAG